MVKKLLALVAVLCFAVVGAAHAAPYPPPANGVSATSPAQQGGAFTATAQTFTVGAVVTFTLEGQGGFTGTATANASGVATYSRTIPANTKPGSHVLKAKGTGADGKNLTLTTKVEIVGSTAVLGASVTRSPEDGAANYKASNASSFPTTNVGLATLAGLGLIALLGVRRRKSAADVLESADA